MKIGIMQPYFFPHLEYYNLIQKTDKWVIFDDTQFIRHGWIERNRILKPGMGWQYIKVPLVKHNQLASIKDITIRNNEPWKEKILAQLQHYKKIAPNYRNTIEVVKESLSINTDSIVALNRHVFKITCDYLNIKFNPATLSEMNLNLDKVHKADEWALNISKKVNANEYINPRGGEALFCKEKYKDNNIKLSFMEENMHTYDQSRAFESGLSIIDVMMFNDNISFGTVPEYHQVFAGQQAI